MTDKLNGIKNSKHPYSDEIQKTITLVQMIFDCLTYAICILGSIIALIASFGLSERVDAVGNAIKIPVHFFGYIIELKTDTFGGSPFIVFLYIIIVFALIDLAIFCIKMILITVLNSKAAMLDSVYHSEKMTELLVEDSYPPQAETTEPQANRE